MVLTLTETDGVELVHRSAGELPIAQLTAPRAMPRGVRAWGIRYRDSSHPEQPFSGPFNAAKKTREKALADVEWVVRVCSDHQLGLA